MSRRKSILAGTSIILLSASLLMQGCKKTDTINNSSEQIAAQAINKLKPVDLQLVADNFTSPIGVVAVPVQVIDYL